jgi:hypothetical protein
LDERLVLLFGGKLEELGRFIDLFREGGCQLYFLEQRRSLPENRLSLALVIPKPGFARDLV